MNSTLEVTIVFSLSLPNLCVGVQIFPTLLSKRFLEDRNAIPTVDRTINTHQGRQAREKMLNLRYLASLPHGSPFGLLFELSVAPSPHRTYERAILQILLSGAGGNFLGLYLNVELAIPLISLLHFVRQ